MAPRSRAAGRAALLLAAAALLGRLGGAAAWKEDLPSNLAFRGGAIASSDSEQVAVDQILHGFLEVAEEVLSGKEVPSRVSAMAAPPDLHKVNASAIQAKVTYAPLLLQAEQCCRPAGAHTCTAIMLLTADTAAHVQVFAAALTTWQTGVWNAPSNAGLRPQTFLFYDRWHYYQVPVRPVGTVSLMKVFMCDAYARFRR